MARGGLVALALALLLLLALQPVAQAQTAEEGWLLAAYRVAGQYDIYAMPADGGSWQALTKTPDDERWPAWSPDGRQVTYAARRNQNWDLYLLDLRSGNETRLTEDEHFDGYPAWSPDGRQIAFSSMRGGDLDIFVLDLDSGALRNLTASSSAIDVAPQWENNRRLFYISTAEGSQDIYRLSVALGEDSAQALTQTAEVDERALVPLPRGEMLALQVELPTREIQHLDAEGEPHGETFSWTQAVVALTLAPSGEEVAWVERRWEGDTIYRMTLDGGEMAQRLYGPSGRIEDIAWGQPATGLLEERLRPAARPGTTTYQTGPRDFVEVEDLEAPDPALSEAVLSPYERLRSRVEATTGIDFLAVVSETVRPIDYATEESDYLSWHKAGRAIDTLLFISSPDGVNRGYVLVRDDWHSDVFWRILIRCPDQDGSCGQPLVEAPWEYAEGEEADDPGAGGAEGAFIGDYYVDFTLMAWDEGWERIASYQTPEFDWRESLFGMEYWHYQRTDGLTWYEAMAEVYDDETLDALFGWEELQAREIAPWILRAKGVPLPPEVNYAPLRGVVP